MTGCSMNGKATTRVRSAEGETVMAKDCRKVNPRSRARIEIADGGDLIDSIRSPIPVFPRGIAARARSGT